MNSIPDETILKYLQDQTLPLRLNDLVEGLHLSFENRRALKKRLSEMVHMGALVKTHDHRYGLPKNMNRVEGSFCGHRDGYGFVTPDTGEGSDLFIQRRNARDVMHRDRVVARVEQVQKGERREGSIVQITKRAHSRIVGRYEAEGSVVVPSDRRILQWLSVTAHQNCSPRTGDMVVAEVMVYPSGRQHLQGRIVEVLGHADDPRVDTKIVAAAYGLSIDFSEIVLEEADQLPAEVSPEMIAGRTDLRALPTVTIDGERARDFDDAISIETLDTGFCLWVHIADVGHYVPLGSALDQEAALRGTSVYFPDAVLPMFPERLSNGICSLNPNEDRLTLTAEMRFDPEGNQVGGRLYESVIRSCERMTYTSVGEICLGTAAPTTRTRYARLLPQFAWMQTLAMALRKKRLDRGSLDFDIPEPEIILNAKGETTDVVRVERNVAHQIIEEFMLAANELVAQQMTAQSVPFVYRVHDSPDPEVMRDFADFIRVFGLSLDAEEVTPLALSHLLTKVKGAPEEPLVSQLLLRSMKQARYTTDPRGHFGLAALLYTHFTSPIRRYPDLLVHRIVKRMIHGGMTQEEKATWAQILPPLADHSSQRERLSLEAEREVMQRKKVNFMADKIGLVYTGRITGVASYGLFVELDQFLIQGLLHVRSLRDDYYFYDERQHSLTGERHHQVFRLGDPISVFVKHVDCEGLQIDFVLPPEKSAPEMAQKSAPEMAPKTKGPVASDRSHKHPSRRRH